MERDSIYKRYTPAISPEQDDYDTAYWFVFCSNKLLLNPDDGKIPHTASLSELGFSPVRTQYLGTLEGYPCYSAEVSPDIAVPEGMALSELRPLYGVLDEDIYILAGKALQIVNWDQAHQYCGRCGNETETLQDERAKKCPVCGFLSFPRLSPAVITAVLKGNSILLTRYAGFRGNMHTIVAGFVEPGETLEEAIRREVLEEAGINVKNINYFGSQPWPFPNSLMIGFTAEYESGEISVDGKEIAEAGWYDLNNLPEIPPNWSIARHLIDWCVQNKSGNT
ncbi:NAD(+) diphosphatase [Chloroflexota bacterium]